MKSAPRVPTAIEFAARASDPSWAVTPATAVNIHPVTVNVAPISSETPGLPPHRIVTRLAIRPRASDPIRAIPVAAISRLARPRTPEASSSACPESSCPRVARVTAKIAPSAARNPPSARLRQALKPSTVVRSRAGPKISPRAGLEPIAAARPLRSASVGNTHG